MQEARLKLNNRLTYYATALLTLYFFLTFGFIILPKLPQSPTDLGEWRISISSWNFGGSTMFTLVFRIQILRGIFDRLNGKRERMRVTPWVWFWFTGLAAVGFLSLIALFYSYLFPGFFGSGKSAPTHDFLTLSSLMLWTMLIALSISLLRTREECPKQSFGEIRRAIHIHRLLLGPSTVAFFIFSVVLAPMAFFFI